MRIAFICGRLDGGGVSDYTQLLARELYGMGHDCLCLSLNEKQSDETGNFDGVTVIRSTRSSAPQALERLAQWEADWISLQFVSFAFQEKGLVRYLIPLIHEAGRNSSLQIMFHELWVRPGKGAPLKHVLLGCLQKKIVLDAVKSWQPEKIHTSNELYRQILVDSGIEAEILPLFGNVPIGNPDQKQREPSAAKNLRRIVMPFSQSKNWDVAGAMRQLEQCANAAGVTLEIIQVGFDRDGACHWDYIEGFAQKADWAFRRLGPLEPKQLSAIMQEADLGLNSIHKEMAGRSGAVVSMREHGLTVLCAGPANAEKEYSFSNLDRGTLSLFQDVAACVAQMKEPTKAVPESRLSKVAETFIKSLNAHS